MNFATCKSNRIFVSQLSKILNPFCRLCCGVTDPCNQFNSSDQWVESALTKERAVLRAATIVLRLDEAQCGSLPAWDTAINHTAELWVNLQVTTHFNVCMHSDKGQCCKGSESPEAAGCLFVSQAWSCSVAAGLML